MYYNNIRKVDTDLIRNKERRKSYEECTKKEEPPERVLLRNQSEILNLRVSRKI